MFGQSKHQDTAPAQPRNSDQARISGEDMSLADVHAPAESSPITRRRNGSLRLEHTPGARSHILVREDAIKILGDCKAIMPEVRKCCESPVPGELKRSPNKAVSFLKYCVFLTQKFLATPIDKLYTLEKVKKEAKAHFAEEKLDDVCKLLCIARNIRLMKGGVTGVLTDRPLHESFSANLDMAAEILAPKPFSAAAKEFFNVKIILPIFNLKVAIPTFYGLFKLSGTRAAQFQEFRNVWDEAVLCLSSAVKHIEHALPAMELNEKDLAAVSEDLKKLKTHIEGPTTFAPKDEYARQIFEKVVSDKMRSLTFHELHVLVQATPSGSSIVELSHAKVSHLLSSLENRLWAAIYPQEGKSPLAPAPTKTEPKPKNSHVYGKELTKVVAILTRRKRGESGDNKRAVAKEALQNFMFDDTKALKRHPRVVMSAFDSLEVHRELRRWIRGTANELYSTQREIDRQAKEKK